MSDKREITVETKMYACCPICSTLLIYAERVINATIKCSKCNQRISLQIDKGKVTLVPLCLE